MKWQFRSASKHWTIWRRRVDMTIRMLPLCLTSLLLSIGCFICLAFRISSLKSAIAFIIFTCRSSCDNLIMIMDFNISRDWCYFLWASSSTFYKIFSTVLRGLRLALFLEKRLAFLFSFSEYGTFVWMASYLSRQYFTVGGVIWWNSSFVWQPTAEKVKVAVHCLYLPAFDFPEIKGNTKKLQTF